MCATTKGTCEYPFGETTEFFLGLLEEDSLRGRKLRQYGLSIYPDSILFLEAFVGEEYKSKISLRNISTNKINLRIGRPYKQCFEINDDGTQIFLAPGLAIVKEVKFFCGAQNVKDSAFPISVDGKWFDIPIRVNHAEPRLRVSPTNLSFGTINVGGRYVSRYLLLVNAGAEVSSFNIDFGQNALDLIATPRMGTLRPYSVVSVRLDLAAFTPGHHVTQFWIKGCPPTVVHVEVHVLQPFLRAVHPNMTSRFTLIEFDHTYFDTVRYETFIVRNMSVNPTTFVVLAEIEKNLMTFEEIRNVNPEKEKHYRNFSIEPMEGTIQPFESRIFTVWFHPKLEIPDKGWMHEQATQEEYLCFIRVFNIDIRELPNTENTTDGDEDGLNLRLCLHGCAQKPQIGVLTSSFVFEDAGQGERMTRVIQMKNLGLPPVFARFLKAPGFQVRPPERFIQGGKAVELTLTFQPPSLGVVKKFIVFDILSYENMSIKKEKIVIGKLKIPVKVRVQAITSYPKPRFNMGLTPKVFLDVGDHTEEVKFSDDLEKPAMVLIPSSTDGRRPWLKSDACIAFPNDMPKSFRPRITDGLMKSIYTGKKRYVIPSDSKNTYSLSEYSKLKANQEKYVSYLETEAGKKRDYIVLIDNLRNTWLKSPNEMRWYKTVQMQSVLETNQNVSKKHGRDIIIKEQIPLSPKDLYNIVIIPKTLDFGQIPINVCCSREVSIENKNIFPIRVNQHMQRDFTGTDDDIFFIGPKTTVIKSITLNVPNFGRYYSMVSFVINSSDCFDMNVVADVVQRTLTVVPREIQINNRQDDIFQVTWIPVLLVNSLYVPTSFEWRVPVGCGYLLEPESGTVPGQGDICCALYFGTSLERTSGTFLTLDVEDGIPIEVRVSRTQDRSHGVSPFTNKKLLPPLSCNLIHRDTALFFNSGYRGAVFTVVNPNPLEGVNISPIAGVIPSKSCIGIDLEFDMTSIRAIDFTLCLKVQFKAVVEIKYVGFVFFPKLIFSPSVYQLWNIPCYSLSIYSVKAENVGQCPVCLQFKMTDEYPQLKLSETKRTNGPYIQDEDEFFFLVGGSKEFYVHFNPQSFATYEFLLPVVYNKKIGPPILYDDRSQNPLTYVTSAVIQNNIMKHIDLSLPKELTSTKIDVSVGRGHIVFSSWTLDFFCRNKTDVDKKTIVIQNLRSDTTSIVIEPKYFTSNYAFNITKMPKDGLYTIDPEDEIELEFSFSPASDVPYEIQVPVIVKDYHSSTPYNYLNITGKLQKSTLSVSETLIQFLPVPVGVNTERLVKVVAQYQHKDTKLSALYKRYMASDEDIFQRLEFIYPDGNFIPAYNGKATEIPVVLRFRSKETISRQGSFYFSDDCDGTCEIRFTICADNCVMSCYSYMYLCQSQNHQMRTDTMIDTLDRRGSKEDLKNLKMGDFNDTNIDADILEELLDFPMFPKSLSETDYALYMRRILSGMEKWLFEQGFWGSFRMTIGEDVAFSKAFQVGQNSRSKKPQQEYIKSVVDLLFFYVGRDLYLEYQFPTTIPVENLQRISYSLNIYRQVLKFLQVQGGNVSHIFPVYLLSYEDYYDHLIDLKGVEYKSKGKHFEEIFEEMCSKKKILPAEQFERYNKQAWLDVFLQIHRTVIQSGTPFIHEYKRCLQQLRNDDDGSSTCLHDSSDTLMDKEDKIWRTLDKADKTLVNWLNVTYAHVKMGHPDLCIPNRQVTDLVQDLEDAVVLIAVTIFYCPYLIDDYFNNFYPEPNDRNQIHHNATQLCIAWSTIKVGLSVNPGDFFHLNPVFMVILVSHLYRVLRSYVPERTVEFLCSLTCSVTRKLSLTNPNDSNIGYSMKIIGDYSNVFTFDTSRSVIVITPKSSAKISITFSAKKLTPVKATLLLCGTCLPNGYVENIVLTLYGDPYNLLFSRDYTIHAPIMKPVFIITKLTSPYNVEAEYEIWFADEEPKPGVLDIRPWRELKGLKLPRSIFLGSDRLVIPPDGGETTAPLSVTAACFTRSLQRFWIIFKNEEVGDFIIRVTLRPRVESPSLILRVRGPVGLCTGYPGSLCSTRCPRLLRVMIPSRNTRLWSTVKTMLLLTLDKKEHAFWEEHYETRIGLDLMKWMLGKADRILANEISFIFESKVKYKLTSLSPHIQVQEYLEIDDIHSREFVELLVHLCCRINSDFCADILLESESGQEIRLYRLKFCGESPEEFCTDECRKGCNFNESIPSQICFNYNVNISRYLTKSFVKKNKSET